jgi:hypothetical protein
MAAWPVGGHARPNFGRTSDSASFARWFRRRIRLHKKWWCARKNCR